MQVVEYAAELAAHPATWMAFPLTPRGASGQYQLTAPQQVSLCHTTCVDRPCSGGMPSRVHGEWSHLTNSTPPRAPCWECGRAPPGSQPAAALRQSHSLITIWPQLALFARRANGAPAPPPRHSQFLSFATDGAAPLLLTAPYNIPSTFPVAWESPALFTFIWGERIAPLGKPHPDTPLSHT